jgi:protein-S-isoprenylcysteine O-methyltransferase Ste14
VWLFLIPLLLGFALNAASAFTAAYSRRWGERGGRWASFVLRNILGIPLWAMGLGFAVQTPSTMLVAPNLIMNIMGWLLIVAGGMVILWALGFLGKRAAAPSMRDTLVMHGAYAHVRHPIHSGTFLEFAGLWLLRPTVAVAVASALGVVWLLVQTRLEEIDLVERIPAYRGYKERVPRFVPRFGKGVRRHRS